MYMCNNTKVFIGYYYHVSIGNFLRYCILDDSLTINVVFNDFISGS